MSWSEVLIGVKDHLEHRVKDHFTGTFTMFLILTNWDVWTAFIYSPNDYQSKISAVVTTVMIHKPSDRFIMFPIYCTLTYRVMVFGLSTVSYFVILLGKLVQNWLRVLFDSKTFLTIKASNDQRMREIKLKAEIESSIISRDQRIEELEAVRDRINMEKGEIKILKDKMSEQINELLDAWDASTYSGSVSANFKRISEEIKLSEEARFSFSLKNIKAYTAFAQTYTDKGYVFKFRWFDSGSVIGQISKHGISPDILGGGEYIGKTRKPLAPPTTP